MSLALSSARSNVFQLIRDVDRSAPAVKGYIIDQAIANHYQLVHARLHVPLAWGTLKAITAGTATYTLTGAAAKEFHSIALFRLASNLHLIEPVGPAWLEQWRQNIPAQQGEPIAVSRLEAAPAAVGTTETTFTLYPTPSATDTLEGLSAAMAATLSADADLIQLGPLAQRAIEYSAAAELLAAMPDETAARLQVNRAVARDYGKNAESYIEWEQTRISRARAARFGNRSYHRN